MSGADDVRRALAAASKVASDRTIIQPLALSTGLSREGVELALARHVETSASDEDIASLVAYAGRADHVHVILSANVFVAAVRAVAIAVAASDRVTVKPSRREPVFAKALVGALADPRVTIGDGGEGASEIHVYGRDETIAEVRRSAGPNVRVRGHGAGMGVAIVTRDFDRAARDLAEDVIPFDQRGCLSPRVAWVRGDAEAFAEMLFDALESRGREIPRGTFDEAEEAARWCDTITYAGGTLHRGATCAVGVANVRAIPPTGRHVLVRPFPVTLEDDARYVVAVGSDMSPDESRAIAPPHARISALGMMQRPPLDGPVDRR